MPPGKFPCGNLEKVSLGIQMMSMSKRVIAESESFHGKKQPLLCTGKIHGIKFYKVGIEHAARKPRTS